MDELSVISCDVYRGYVHEDEDFVPYFCFATLKQELNRPSLGSRSVKRRPAGGVGSLRAVPRIFAQTQNHLILPAQLGVSTALQKMVEDDKQSELEVMCRDWPFLSTRLGMLEIVLVKADLQLVEHYDQRLVDKALWLLGRELRNLQEEDIKVVLAIANGSYLMADLLWIVESIQLRSIYTDPLSVLQAELLHHPHQAEREGQEPGPRVKQVSMATIAGIAAGMCSIGQSSSSANLRAFARGLSETLPFQYPRSQYISVYILLKF